MYIYKITTQICCDLTSDTHSHAECVQPQRSFYVWMRMCEIKNVSESIKHTKRPTNMMNKIHVYIKTSSMIIGHLLRDDSLTIILYHLWCSFIQTYLSYILFYHKKNILFSVQQIQFFHCTFISNKNRHWETK
jgi:hypothetical protein